MDTTLTDPLVGQLLDGRYRVQSRIARGGMATVYLALDIRLDRTVALKVMHRSLAEDPQFVRRFIGEAKSVASLSHPNIVQVFDQGTDGDHVYLSMEYVPGKTLRDVLRSRGRLPAREALEIMIPVLAALGAAHQAGLIHRDVKPENVLLTDDGRVKVVDFGLARAVEASNQTKTGMMIGTIAYMSPEQVTAGVADARSDVYAAGIMLFELITGRQPYEGETPMSIAYRHVHDSVPLPSSIVPETPQPVDTVVAAATNRDPAMRPVDAASLLVAAVDAHRMPAPGNQNTGPHGSLPTGAHATTVLPSPVSGTAAPYSTGPYPAGPHASGPYASGPQATGAQVPPGAGHTMIQPRAELPSGPASPSGGAGRSGFRPTWFIVGLAIVMVAGIVFSGWWFSQGRYTHVPDLLGQNVKVAQQQAQNAGFEVTIGTAKFDDKVGKDAVLAMEPGVGAEVATGSVLTLIPSAGPETVMVPNVQGLSEADARVKITNLGLTVSRVSKTASDTVQRGLVVRTSPKAGAKVKKDSSVTLAISAGLLMPDVTQMTKDQAVQFLQEKGYTVQVDEVTDDAAPGTVIAQDPPAGTEVQAQAQVRLTASKGPEQGFHFPWENDDSQPDPDYVTVPDVRFKDLSDARQELVTAGLKVRVRKLVGARRVVGQNPPGGTSLPLGTTVTIWH